MGLSEKIKRAREILFNSQISIEHEGVKFTYRNPKISQRFNLLSHPLSRFNQTLFPPKPHMLHIGVTTHCNLDCPTCFRNAPSFGKKPKHLNFETYTKFVDVFKDKLMLALFWDWGEPMECPDLEKMIAYASKLEAFTLTSTNFVAPISDERMTKIIESGLSVIIVCVEGASQKTYSALRPNGNLDAVLKNSEKLIKFKNKLNSPFPVVNFRTHLTKENEKDIPKLREMAENYGADIFSLKTVRPFNYAGNDFDDALVPEQNILSRYSYSNSNKGLLTRNEKVKVKSFTCGKPFFLPTLESSGDIKFCSYANEDEEMNFGNVESEKSVKEIWINKKSRLKRKSFLKNKGASHCKQCYFRSIDLPPTVIECRALRMLPENISVAS